MDDGSWLRMIALVLLLMGSAYFSAAESSYASLKVARIKSLADDGDRRAKKALYISNNFDRALTTILVGNNVMNLGCSALATLLATQINMPVAWATLITTVIILLVGEITPKSYAKANPEKMALAFSASLRVLMKLLSPVVFVFSGINRLAGRVFSAKEEPSVTKEELASIIDTVGEEGVLDEEQSELLQSAMEFSETTAADILTVRSDIVGIELSMTGEQIRDRIRNSGHSRLPVYEGDPDHIVGILPIRDYLKAVIRGEEPELRALMLPPYFAKPGDTINELLGAMSRSRNYLAVIRTPDGKTAGIVTVEDFLEELVGEIWDEDDQVSDDFMKLGGDRYEVSGLLTLGDFYARVGLLCPENRKNKMVQTWVLERLGHFPAEEETFAEGNLEAEVSEIRDHRIAKVILHICGRRTAPAQKKKAGAVQ